MNEPPARRRWFAFSLRTLFVLVTALCLWLGWNIRQVHMRKTMLGYVSAQGALVRMGAPTKPWKAVPLWWSLLGAEPVSAIDLPKGSFSDDDCRQIEPWFPEAEISRSRSGGGMGMGMM